MPLRPVLAAVLATLALATPASAALQHGEIGQLAGTNGCVYYLGGPEGCAAGRGFTSSNSIAISPDGKNVYATGQNDVLALSRNGAGGLDQIQCLSTDGNSPDGSPDCADSTALLGAYSVEVSPDGSHVYVGGTQQIAIFARNASTGMLTYQDCAANNGTSDEGTPCTENTRGLYETYDLAFARDGRTLYATANAVNAGGLLYNNDGVVMFAVGSDGGLDQPSGVTGCYTDTGDHLDPGLVSGGCTNVRAMNQGGGLVVSPDGKQLYTQSGSNEMGEYSIDQTTGALTQIGCLSEDGNAQGATGGEPTTCTDIRAVGDYYAMISPDGKHVYAANSNPSLNTVSMFVRDPASGLLSQPDTSASCISETGNSGMCTDGRSLEVLWNLAIAPDGRTVYVAGAATNGSVAVLDRDPATGFLTQASGLRGCVSNTGTGATCVDGRSMVAINAIAVSSDNAFVYAIGAYGPVSFSRGVPPVCSNTSASTAFGAPVAVTLNCSDANGDALTITPAAPAHGSLGAVIAGKVTYTPTTGYSGADAFSYSASDGANASGAVTAALTVGAAPATTPPVTTPPVTTPPVLATGTPALLGGTAKVDKKGRFVLKLSCPAGGGACRGNVKVRTASAVSAAKKRVLALAAKAYTVAAGKSATVRLTLSAKGRRLLKKKGTIKALATFAPAGGGKKTTRKLTLKRA
ncbi:MAG: Ig-like domain-containing protein [Solirubrobacteraceae bacterium]